MKRNKSPFLNIYIVLILTILPVAITLAPVAIGTIREWISYDVAPMVTVLIFAISVIYLLLLIMFLIFRFERKRNQENFKDIEKHYFGKYDYHRSEVEDRIIMLTKQFERSQERWDELYHLIVPSNNNSALNSGEITSMDFLKKNNVNLDELEIDDKLIFVLTPFGNSFIEDFISIREVCNECGFHAVRGDEDSVQGKIIEHIIQAISKSRLVIANINGRNPNVFYELGIAHMMNKPTILVSYANKQREVPFDISSQRVIFYDNAKQLKATLRIALKAYTSENEDIVFDEMKDTNVSAIAKKVARIIDMYKDSPEKKRYTITLLRSIFSDKSKAKKIIYQNDTLRPAFEKIVGVKRMKTLSDLLHELNFEGRKKIEIDFSTDDIIT
jgi:hypothetical protein